MEFSDSLDDLIALQNIGKRRALNSNDQFAKKLNVRNFYVCVIN